MQMTILNYAESRSRPRRFGSMEKSRERVTNRRAEVANLQRMKCQVEPRAHLSPDRVRRRAANESLAFRFAHAVMKTVNGSRSRAQRQLTIKYFAFLLRPHLQLLQAVFPIRVRRFRPENNDRRSPSAKPTGGPQRPRLDGLTLSGLDLEAFGGSAPRGEATNPCPEQCLIG